MTEAQEKKVLISCPMRAGIQDTDPTKWLRSYLNIIADVRRSKFTYAPYFPVGQTWYMAMNNTFNIAFEHDFDYILRIDDDVWNIGLDYFTRLLEADKDVIGACYPMRHFPYLYAALHKVDQSEDIVTTWDKTRYNLFEESGDGIKKVDMIGFGMTLIKTAPFRLLPRPIFPKDGEQTCPDDTWFSKLCADNKIEQYVHMDCKMAHRDITPFNRNYIYNADARFLLQSKTLTADGSPFTASLIEKFGADGRLEIGQLK